ncbi:MAG: M23 family metallopeptidase [Firmicutes bacterium]|nr:M23 family metallopeptidase [Bacillota bacterium]
MKLLNIKSFWNKLRKQWANRFLIIIRNENNLSIVFTLKLSPRRVFVLGTTAFLLIIILTAVLIAFTSLRVYVPGYTNPVEHQLYRKMLTRVDSIERINATQKIYLDNFFSVLSDLIISEEMSTPEQNTTEKRIKDKSKAEEAINQVAETAEMLWVEIADRSAKSFLPLTYQQVSTPTFAFTMPALGVVTQPFSIEERRFGIVIENERGTLITAIADGIVISAETSDNGNYSIIIQHSGNVVSIYNNVGMPFKKKGAKVKSGDPIAIMGNEKNKQKKPYLYFELWYNGTPINPLTYNLF